jgi:hypothetical protein
MIVAFRQSPFHHLFDHTPIYNSQFTDNPNDSDHNSDHSPLHTSEVLTAEVTSKRVEKVKKDDKGDPLAEFYSQARADVDAKSRVSFSTLQIL